VAGFLDEYGVADERRAKFIRRLAIAAVALAAIGLTLYFTLRTWPAKSQVRAFLGELARKDYQAAYRVWGCTPPCRDYSFERFMEDWGPRGEYANAQAASIKRARVCNSGDILITLSSPKGGETPLMYETANRTLGFAPWPICDPRVPAPAAP